MSATTAGHTMSFRFTGDDVRSRHSLAVWREAMGRSVLELDLALLPDRPFHSEISTWMSHGLRLTRAIKSGLRMERTPRLLADGNDDLGLHIGEGGSWAVTHRGKEIALDVGDAVLVSNGETASVTCATLSRCLCIQLPRSALAPLVPNVDDALMRPIPKGSEALRLLAGYAEALRTSGAHTAPELQHLVAGHMRDLVAVILGATGEAAALAASGGIRAARLRAIKAGIVERLGDADLSIESVAARHGVSARYIQMLFQAEDATFSTFVRAQRLALAHRFLSDPRSAHRSISAVAFDVGFGDLSYFNHAFRRRYGATPSEIRAVALAEQPRESRS